MSGLESANMNIGATRTFRSGETIERKFEVLGQPGQYTYEEITTPRDENNHPITEQEVKQEEKVAEATEVEETSTEDTTTESTDAATSEATTTSTEVLVDDASVSQTTVA